MFTRLTNISVMKKGYSIQELLSNFEKERTSVFFFLMNGCENLRIESHWSVEHTSNINMKSSIKMILLNG